jgi:cation:H+ antiporter
LSRQADVWIKSDSGFPKNPLANFVILISKAVKKLSLFIPLIVAVLALLIIMKSASYALGAICSYARKTGISEYIIGFFVVSLGTSLPEMCTAVFSSVGNNGAISLGNVLGANVLDVTVILGITAIIGRKIFIRDRMGKSKLIVIPLMFLPLILGFDGRLSRWDGVILICSFFIYTLAMLEMEKTVGKIKPDIKLREIWLDIFVFGGAVAALVLAVRWFVLSTATLAYMMDIPNFIMGVMFVAMGTTTPELIVSIKSVLSGHSGIGLGDLIGAASTNISLVIGVASIINPIYFEPTRFIVSGIYMGLAVTIALMIMKRGKLTWKEGIFMSLLYIVFIAIQGIMGV